MLRAGVDHSMVIGFTEDGILKTFKSGTHAACLSFCEKNRWGMKVNGEQVFVSVIDTGSAFFA